MNLKLNGRRRTLYYFVVKFLAFVREFVELYIQLRYQLDQRIDPAFGVKKFIQHYDSFLLQDTVPALKSTSFITDRIFRFA